MDDKHIQAIKDKGVIILAQLDSLTIDGYTMKLCEEWKYSKKQKLNQKTDRDGNIAAVGIGRMSWEGSFKGSTKEIMNFAKEVGNNDGTCTGIYDMVATSREGETYSIDFVIIPEDELNLGSDEKDEKTIKFYGNKPTLG